MHSYLDCVITINTMGLSGVRWLRIILMLTSVPSFNCLNVRVLYVSHAFDGPSNSQNPTHKMRHTWKLICRKDRCAVNAFPLFNCTTSEKWWIYSCANPHAVADYACGYTSNTRQIIVQAQNFRFISLLWISKMFNSKRLSLKAKSLNFSAKLW